MTFLIFQLKKSVYCMDLAMKGRGDMIIGIAVLFNKICINDVFRKVQQKIENQLKN